ncbi:Fur family transcriptional regulator [Candidatus Rhodobacter oscarellae]|uniref:Fur family transcriptional regulator n=1 Tax=Candidatus Rhodobacter oscarellae TaxID=1675527 RepID=UPI0006712479|nr:transcriptional repressor [Candidatus Rhodobacter lobularis]
MSEKFHSDRGDTLLRVARLQVTKPRLAIARVLVEAEDHPDAEQVLARARKNDPRVSRATVYRTLAALAKNDLLLTHTFDGNATRYELAGRPHHDHIIDVETGEVREFVSHEIERLQARVAEDHGYKIVAHRLELYCRKAL